MWAAGNRLPSRPVAKRASLGFTLLELLVVIAIMAMATAGVSLALRDGNQTALEREAQRLAVLFESARAQSRANGVPVYWRSTDSGFEFTGLLPGALPANWMAQGISSRGRKPVQLGPEPIIGPQTVELVSTGPLLDQPERVLFVVTDGLRPFAVQSTAQP